MKKDSFFGIYSIGKAFLVRGFELILLGFILSFSYSYFPNWNFGAVIIIGTLAVTFISYFLFKEILTMNSNDKRKKMQRESDNLEENQMSLESNSMEPSNDSENNVKKIVQEMNSQTVLKTLEIRLQGIRDVTKRARFSFIVLIIASCAVFIAVWNGHFSWNRVSAFPSDMSFCLDRVNIYSTQELRQCLETQKTETKDEIIISKIDSLLEDERLGKKNFPITEGEKNLLSLDEYNRRNLAHEWLKSTNISIGLLGVVVNMNDLPMLGSLTLMIISFWFVFNIRRENRAIVGLLKDVRNITKFDEVSDKSLNNDSMLIASLTFQETAHSLTFVSIAKDYPLSSKHIFQDNPEETETDANVRRIIYHLRLGGMIFLLLLPAIVILFTLIADYSSLTTNTAFYENFPKIENSLSSDRIWTYVKEMSVAVVCFALTSLICVVSIIFQIKTTDALYVFAEKLGVDVETRFKRNKIPSRKETIKSTEDTDN